MQTANNYKINPPNPRYLKLVLAIIVLVAHPACTTLSTFYLNCQTPLFKFQLYPVSGSSTPVKTLMTEPLLDVAPAAQITSLCSSSRFAQLKTDSGVEQAKASAVPKNTRKNTTWTINILTNWSAHRWQVYKLLDHWLTKWWALSSRHSIIPVLVLMQNIIEWRPEINILKMLNFPVSRGTETLMVCQCKTEMISCDDPSLSSTVPRTLGENGIEFILHRLC